MKFTIDFFLIVFVMFSNANSQAIISKEKAIQIAIDNGIAEPIDSFIVTLINDTIWEVESIFCYDYSYYHSRSEIFSIHAITGEKFELNRGTMTINMIYERSPHTHINYDYIDSLIPINRSTPVILLPDSFETISDAVISPDNEWIAFTYGYKSIAIISIDGRNFKKICDNCLYPNWTEKRNTLIYEKDYKHIYEYNIVTNENNPITYNDSRFIYFSYCPKGKWLAYIKSVPLVSENSNEIIISSEDVDYDLFILSLQDGMEKRITFNGEVGGFDWKSTGDTIFFYMNDVPHYSTDFDSVTPEYGVANHLEDISIRDYANSVDNGFVYNLDCQLLLIDLSTLKPEKYILKKRDRYGYIRMSNDGKYITYTVKKGDKWKLYLIENK